MSAVRRCRTPGELERQNGQQKEDEQATHGCSLADSDETLLAEPHGGHSGGTRSRLLRRFSHSWPWPRCVERSRTMRY